MIVHSTDFACFMSHCLGIPLQTSDPTTLSAPTVALPVMMVAEVQDSLLVVVHDLNRLDGLLAHAMENLMQRFTAASTNLSDPALAALTELEGGFARGGHRIAVSRHGVAVDWPYIQDFAGVRLSPRVGVDGARRR